MERNRGIIQCEFKGVRCNRAGCDKKDAYNILCGLAWYKDGINEQALQAIDDLGKERCEAEKYLGQTIFFEDALSPEQRLRLYLFVGLLNA